MNNKLTRKQIEEMKRKFDNLGINQNAFKKKKFVNNDDTNKPKRLFKKKNVNLANWEFALVNQHLKLENKEIKEIDDRVIEKYNRYNDYFLNDNKVNKIQLNSQIKKNKIEILDKNEKPAKVNMSKIFKFEKKQKKTEEKNPHKKNTHQKKKMNWMIESFIPTTKGNQIDDLGQILLKSKKYNQIINILNQKKKKFEDKKFLPNMKSLTGFHDSNKALLKKFQNIIWKRPEDFLKEKEIIIYKKISPEDIRQGQLGDCYFLAAISSIALHPHRLERLFLIKNYNKEDIYGIALCINGVWQEVLLDGYIPCINNRPAFNSNKSGHLWVILLEKAWAKIHGGYYNINSGLTREALHDLTGAPAKTLFVEDFKQDDLWLKLLKYQYKKFILTAGSDNLNNGQDNYISKIGIAGSHAYSLLGIYEMVFYKERYIVLPFEKRNQFIKMNNKGLVIERIFKLRNPWGKGEWKGDWSDNDKRWNSQLKKEMNHSIEEDGTFYIGYKSFIKYFSDIQVCKYHDKFKYSSQTFKTQPIETVFLTFNVGKKGKFYFSVNQKNKRFFSEKTGYNYSTLSMLVFFKSKNNKLKYIGSKINLDKEIWISSTKETVGQYFIYIKTNWTHFVNEFNFSVYGESKVNIKKINRSQFPKNFLQRVFSNLALTDTKIEIKNLGNGIMMRKVDNHEGFGFLFFKNEDNLKTSNIIIDIDNSKSIKSSFPYFSLKPNLVIPPNHHDIFVYEAVDLPYMAQMRIIYTQRQEKKDLFNMIMKKGNMIKKKDENGKFYDTVQYILNHKRGVYILTINNSRDYIFNEMIYFKLYNCKIEGFEDPFLELVLMPQNKRLINIKEENPNHSFDAEIYKVVTKFFLE